MANPRAFKHSKIEAIKRSIKLGKDLKRDHPEIATIYGYFSQGKILEMLDILSKYNVSNNVAVNGIHYTIVGHDGYFGIEAYEGQISDKKERENIGRLRHYECGLLMGISSFENGTGIHEMTSEQNRINGSKGGRRSYNERTGIHGRTKKQMKIDGRSGGLKLLKEKKGFMVELRNNI